MDKRAALTVLGLLQANWAHIEVTDGQTHVWTDRLRDIPEASGLATANILIDTSEHFPTVYEFREAWKAHQRRAVLHAEPPALPAAVPAEVPLRYIREMRAMLRKKTA